MSKYVVVTFPDEAKAYDGTRALLDLHLEGNLTVYAAGMIAKDSDGRVSLKDGVDEGPIGAALGMLTGGLVGILGGPAGVAVGAASGVLLGSLVDLDDAGVGTDFVDAVGKRMSPGTVAVVAEIEEYWLTSLDVRMQAIGGTVYRRWRADLVDQQIEQEIEAWNAELDELDAELAQGSDDAKAALNAKITEVRTNLQEAQDKAKKRLDQLENEAQAKIKELQDQASKVSSEAKAKINKRIEELKTDYEARTAKLKQSWELTKQALA